MEQERVVVVGFLGGFFGPVALLIGFVAEREGVRVPETGVVEVVAVEAAGVEEKRGGEAVLRKDQLRPLPRPEARGATVHQRHVLRVHWLGALRPWA